MLYKTLKRLVAADIKEYGVISDELREKIDLLYACGRLTDEQYKDLIGEY